MDEIGGVILLLVLVLGMFLVGTQMGIVAAQRHIASLLCTDAGMTMYPDSIERTDTGITFVCISDTNETLFMEVGK